MADITQTKGTFFGGPRELRDAVYALLTRDQTMTNFNRSSGRTTGWELSVSGLRLPEPVCISRQWAEEYDESERRIATLKIRDTGATLKNPLLCKWMHRISKAEFQLLAVNDEDYECMHVRSPLEVELAHQINCMKFMCGRYNFQEVIVKFYPCVPSIEQYSSDDDSETGGQYDSGDESHDGSEHGTDKFYPCVASIEEYGADDILSDGEDGGGYGSEGTSENEEEYESDSASDDAREAEWSAAFQTKMIMLLRTLQDFLQLSRIEVYPTYQLSREDDTASAVNAYSAAKAPRAVWTTKGGWTGDIREVEMRMIAEASMSE